MSQRSLAEAYESLKALQGQQGPQTTGAILRRDVERFAIASADANGVYMDDGAARDAGYAGIPAPPLMLSSTIEWGAGPPTAELRLDGTGVDREGWLPLEGLRLVGGGQELVFHADVVVGTEFVAQPRLEDVVLKEGSSGALLLLVFATEFTSTAGDLLLDCRETLIAR